MAGLAAFCAITALSQKRTMHLQQTKVASRATGGPQYYFHDVPSTIKSFLRNKGACPVILETPYGIAKSPFVAVGKDHKLTSAGDVIAGRVGHDRIQQGSGAESIGEAIRHWYAIKDRGDFEHIDIDVRIHTEGHFILAPTKVVLRGKHWSIPLRRPLRPLSFHRDLQSRLWKDQIAAVKSNDPDAITWAGKQIQAVVADHVTGVASVSEADLLRTGGALSKLGLHLGPYLLSGYDCQQSTFKFLKFPDYPCPVEVKKRSRGFAYQIENYRSLPRAVVLCISHDLENPPEDIDVIELAVLGDYLANTTA